VDPFGDGTKKGYHELNGTTNVKGRIIIDARGGGMGSGLYVTPGHMGPGMSTSITRSGIYTGLDAPWRVRQRRAI
jgi:hypothetical protein